MDLNARHTLYPYTCTGCGYPDLAVGSDIQNDELGKTVAPVTAVPPALVQFGCDSGQPVKIVTGDPLSVIAASPGSIVWVLSGNGGDPNWTVSDFEDGTTPTIICNSGSFNQSSSKCTLDPSKLTAGHTYYYALRAYDAVYNLSGFSTEASKAPEDNGTNCQTCPRMTPREGEMSHPRHTPRGN